MRKFERAYLRPALNAVKTTTKLVKSLLKLHKLFDDVGKRILQVVSEEGGDGL